MKITDFLRSLIEFQQRFGDEAGSQIAHDLHDAGERVVVLDDLSTCFRRAVPADVPVVVGDCGDAALLAAIIAQEKVAAIIHLAASAIVPDSVKDPIGYYRNNTVKSCTLIEAAVKGKVGHFIFLVDRGGIRQPARAAGHRRGTDTAGVALWPLEADDRADAGRRRGRTRDELRRAALLQCRRGGSSAADRPVDAGRNASQ
jgi:hypothetical protein